MSNAFDGVAFAGMAALAFPFIIGGLFLRRRHGVVKRRLKQCCDAALRSSDQLSSALQNFEATVKSTAAQLQSITDDLQRNPHPELVGLTHELAQLLQELKDSPILVTQAANFRRATTEKLSSLRGRIEYSG